MNLNPFDLRGPEFLGFYFCLSALTFVVVWVARRWIESGPADEAEKLAGTVAGDPYQIAFLRGGRYEAVHVAVVSLLERGLLEAEQDMLASTKPDGVEKVRRPLDRAILTKFLIQKKAQSLFSDQVILAEADALGEPLKEQKLVPDGETILKRLGLGLAAVGFLWLVALVKVGVALSRGRTNVGFLIVLAILAAVVIVVLLKRRRTSLGDQVWIYLEQLFVRLKDRPSEELGSSTASELTFLAAVFGMAALPGSIGGIIELLHLRLPGSMGGDRSSFGSSCSSGGSCGGGGCGGGGCGGGGCGGCGG